MVTQAYKLTIDTLERQITGLETLIILLLIICVAQFIYITKQLSDKN